MAIRILHISTRLILGGSQENTVLSCEGQSRLGHKVHLAYGPIFGPEGSMLERVREFNARCERREERTASGDAACPIVLHEVPTLVREISPFTDLRCYKALKTLIARVGPDVVHTHSSKAGIIGRAAAWRVHRAHRGMSAFTSMRAQPGPWPTVVHTIHGPPFMPEEGTQWRRFKIRCKNAVFAAAERYAAARCHRIVSVADAMTSQFLARGIGRAERYATVYSGMEVAQFTSAPAITAARSALGLTPDRFVVGTVARLAEHKGHDDLLLALAPEFKARPELVLLWVGDGWRREALVSRAKAMGLGTAQLDQGERPGPDTQLVLTGLIEPEAVPRHIAAMDVLAHPSYREGLPRTVPQALLAGVCPVAYDVDGTGEICRELETGRLVPLGDLERLAQAICWCIDQPVARRALAARGRAECLERFDARTMVARLEKVYQDAIACSLVR